MHNNLFLNRLLINKNSGGVAYDEKFHSGVNIIHGDNSSGKSTISHFIFYALGGAFSRWVKEAKHCSEVLAEVKMNGTVFTIKRSIEEHTNTPVYVHWGTIDSLNSDSISYTWSKFGYATTTERKSFSNVFFENLDLPIVYGDNNITMHQILRLLYVDQDSPTNSLFLYEQFDSQLNREVVSDLLLGVYDEELYKNKISLRLNLKEFDQVKNEITGVKKFIGKLSDLDSDTIYKQISKLEESITSKQFDIIKLKDQTKRVNYGAKSQLEFEKLNSEAITQREKVKQINDRISIIKYEIDDTVLFIESLKENLGAVKNSILTRDFLGEFQLDHCPECLSKIEESNIINQCKLCKNTVDETFGITQAKKIEQELDFQIKESTRNLAKKMGQRDSLEIEMDSEKVENINIQKRVNSALNDVKSFRSEKIDTLYTDKGFLEGEIIQLRTLLENAESYENLIQKRIGLEEKIEKLNGLILEGESKQEQLKIKINKKVKNCGLELLRNDLYRQKEFKNAKEFNIDYRNNIAFLDDKDLRFSASSDFYLKTTARYSLFFASLEVESMRYPRFILCDNMEDKGIEAIRAQNFQKLIIDKSKKYKNEDFQLIYTTSFITEDLKNSSYTVGEYYTESNPSLKI